MSKEMKLIFILTAVMIGIITPMIITSALCTKCTELEEEVKKREHVESELKETEKKLRIAQQDILILQQKMDGTYEERMAD